MNGAGPLLDSSGAGVSADERELTSRTTTSSGGAAPSTLGVVRLEHLPRICEVLVDAHTSICLDLTVVLVDECAQCILWTILLNSCSTMMSAS